MRRLSPNFEFGIINLELKSEPRHLVSYKSQADDEAASGTPEHSLSGRAQTSRSRLAMTHRRGRIINAHPTRKF